MLLLVLLTNLVILLSDDQRAMDISGIPASQAMPNVAELIADHGVTFPNAFATTPLCAPSRASILTGLYAHNHGVNNNADGAGDFDDSDTIATRLRAAGYQTSYIGKYLNGYSGTAVPAGWSDWHVFSGWPYYYDYTLNDNGALHRPNGYATDVLKGRAVSFIQQASGPFFLVLAPYGPHTPAIPAPRHDGMMEGIAPWRPASWNEDDVSDKAEWLQEIPKLGPGLIAQIDQGRKDQLETALANDDAVGAVVEALDAKGVLADTVIVYMSDNGYSWGEHRLVDKNAPYEEAARINMIIRYDPLTSGSVDSRIVANIDVPMTLLDFAGISASADGRSLRPLMDGSAASWRPGVTIEHWQDKVDKPRSDPPDYTAYRSEDHMSIDWIDGSHEEYDLSADPYQLEAN